MFFPINQFVTLFYVCLCLKARYFIYIANSLGTDSWSIALWLMLEGSLSNTCIFSVRHTKSFSYCRTLRKHSSSSQLVKSLPKVKKHKNAKKHGTKLTMRKIFAYSMKLKSELSPVSASAGNMHVEWLTSIATLHMSVKDHKSTSSIDL